MAKFIDFDRAELIRIGDEKTGTLSDSTVFEVSSGSNEGILLKLEPEECYLMMMNVYDENRQLIGRFGSNYYGQTVVARIPIARHKYFYVDVFTENAYGKPFHLTCDSLVLTDEKDGDNESFDTAQSITDDSQVLCWVDEDDDWDVFRITCTGMMENQETCFFVQPSHATMEGKVYLYDSNRNLIEKNSLRGREVRFWKKVNPGDIFYLEVNYKGARDGELRYLVYSIRDGEGGGIPNGSDPSVQAGSFKVLTRKQLDEDQKKVLPSIEGGVELPVASNIWRSNKYLFYCDYPEAVHAEHLVENKCWLCREEVYGAGQAYLWHHNRVGQTIKSCLLVYNNNAFPIVVESTNYGTTQGNCVSDTEGWKSYFTTPYSKKIRVVIQPNHFAELFVQSVPNNHNFGVVARTNVMTLNNSAAKAIFYDVIYTNSSYGADHWATPRNSDDIDQQCRGLAKSYYNVFYLGDVAPKDNSGVYVDFATNKGPDLVEITDQGNCPNSTRIEGSYGQQLVVNMNIRNVFQTDKKFKIQVGSTGGKAFPVIFAKNTAYSQNAVPPFKAVDVIETDFISANSTMNIVFSLAVGAVSCTPLRVKVIPN